MRGSAPASGTYSGVSKRKSGAICMKRRPAANWRSTALVQLDYVAIRIAHEDPLRSGSEAHGAAAQRDNGCLEPLLRGHDIGAQQGEVRDSRVLHRNVHEAIRLVHLWGVETAGPP